VRQESSPRLVATSPGRVSEARKTQVISRNTMVCELRPPLGSRKDKSSPLSGRYNRWQQGNSPRRPSGHPKRVEPLHRGTPSLEFRCTQSSGSQGCILCPKASCPHIRIPLALADETEASELSPINQRSSSALPVWALRCRDLVRLLWRKLPIATLG
jgi:hypothetical protein